MVIKIMTNYKKKLYTNSDLKQVAFLIVGLAHNWTVVYNNDEVHKPRRGTSSRGRSDNCTP